MYYWEKFLLEIDAKNILQERGYQGLLKEYTEWLVKEKLLDATYYQ